MNATMMVWTGRALSGVFTLFMLAASIAPKIFGAKVVGDTLVQLGWSAKFGLLIGLIELTCLILYLVPRTRVLGAVLTMGLLGGAMAAQVRVDNPLFSHVLFSLYLGLLMGGGLWFCDPKLRAVFPFHS